MKKYVIPYLLLSFCLFSLLWASETKRWTETSTKDMKKGTLQGVSLLGSGAITLSPKIKPLVEDPQGSLRPAYYWSQVVDKAGNLYIGSGNEGLLYHITKGGTESILFQAEEYEITALAIDRNDNIYVGTSPQGKIYKVQRSGNSEIFSELEERYIWALAFDAQGNLFAGTGEKGFIYQINKNGDYEAFYNSTEPHIVSLAFDRSGNLLAGSEGHGILYKISSQGEAEVLFTSGMREVSAISVHEDGTIYISAISDRRKDLKPPSIQLKLKELVSGTELEKGAEESAIEQPTEKKFAALIEGFPFPEKEKLKKKPQSMIFRISENGEVERYMSLTDEKIYALGTTEDGALYFGTGDPAKFFRLQAKNRETLLFQLEEAQITSILPLKPSEWSLLTSNPARAYNISSDLESSGTYVSRPFDTKMKSDWGTISCRFEEKPGTRVELFTRSGNSPRPNKEWSHWSKSYNPSGEPVQSPSARYIQWKAQLTRVGAGDSPILNSVTISYLQRNKSPEITSLSLMHPGESLPVSSRKEDTQSDRNKERKIEKGEKGISWKASDPNDDTLLFTLYYKLERGNDWTKIDQIKSKTSFVWDHSSIPDGSYIMRLVADDSPSNYIGEEKSAEILSDPFVVDHSPPHITFDKKVDGDLLLLNIKAEDATGKISKLLYSTDQKEWLSLKPVDRICDSSVEHFEFSAEIKDSGTLFLKCLDDSFNETVIEVK